MVQERNRTYERSIIEIPAKLLFSNSISLISFPSGYVNIFEGRVFMSVTDMGIVAIQMGAGTGRSGVLCFVCGGEEVEFLSDAMWAQDDNIYAAGVAVSKSLSFWGASPTISKSSSLFYPCRATIRSSIVTSSGWTILSWSNPLYLKNSLP